MSKIILACDLLSTASVFVISGFRRDVDEIFAILGYYAALSGNSLPTFRENVSVPSSRVKKFLDFLTLED
jgi:hypothetical protein